jgi:integrase
MVAISRDFAHGFTHDFRILLRIVIMASIRRSARGWRAEVARKGVRASKTFPTQREARDWAARQEYLICHAREVAGAQPVADLLERYAREVSPGHRGERFEALRLAAIGRDRLGKVRLRDLSAADIADWRDRRLREVGPGSVRREMGLLSAVFGVALREWGLVSANPVSQVRRPPPPPSRSRLATEAEVARIAQAAGDDMARVAARVAQAWRFGCETAMRAGEIAALTWSDLDLTRRVARLRVTKNGSAREVPLSSAALALIAPLPRGGPEDRVFVLTTRQIDAVWRKICAMAAVRDLHFHDARHIAITALSRRLDVLALARMVGHRDIRMLMVYYDETAEALARRLE